MTDNDADTSAREPTAGENLTEGDGFRIAEPSEPEPDHILQFTGEVGQILCSVEPDGVTYMHVKDQKIDLMQLVRTLKELLELVDRLSEGSLVKDGDVDRCTCMNHVWRDGGTAACPVHGVW